MDVLIENWPLALIAAVVAILILVLLLRPRQRVSLTDSAPVRPHMSMKPPTGLGIAATAETMTNSIVAASAASVRGGPGSADDLTQLKGVGPKLATLLKQRGITRFQQIASLNADQVDALDDSLGAFRGRLARDHVVDQADYLARGDIDGFEHRFGKL